MFLLHRISGSKPNTNFNTREEIKNSQGPLSFDGCYISVYENRDLLVGRDVTLFVMGDFVGKDNSFDAGQPPEEFCSWAELEILHSLGCRIGWHTHSHRDLRKLSDAELKHELTPPFHTTLLSYPFGVCDGRVVEAARQAGFTEAYCAGEHGDGSELQRKREYLLCL